MPWSFCNFNRRFFAGFDLLMNATRFLETARRSITAHWLSILSSTTNWTVCPRQGGLSSRMPCCKYSIAPWMFGPLSQTKPQILSHPVYLCMLHDSARFSLKLVQTLVCLVCFAKTPIQSRTKQIFQKFPPSFFSHQNFKALEWTSSTSYSHPCNGHSMPEIHQGNSQSTINQQ